MTKLVSLAAAAAVLWCAALVDAQAAQQLSLGLNHACATLSDGTVRCWGLNTTGQLGLEDVSARGDSPRELGGGLPRVQLGSSQSASQVAAATTHSCALTTGGRVKCWGQGNFLGLGAIDTRGDGAGEMGNALGFVDLGTNVLAQQLEGGWQLTCALTTTGRVKCWGRNDYGQLGVGDMVRRGDDPGEMGDALPYVNLGTAAGVSLTAVEIAVGYDHVCALLDNGRVKCWGKWFNGSLGTPDGQYRGNTSNTMGDNLPYVDLGTSGGLPIRAVQITAGDSSACAILTTGQVKCWGDNNYGQVGGGAVFALGTSAATLGNNLPVVDLGTGRTAVQLDSFYRHTCAVLDDGSIKCWGYNNQGQLGQGDLNTRGDQSGELGNALPAVKLGFKRRAVAVAAGGTFSCALLDDNSLKCWGGNASGQLLQGDVQARGDGANELGQMLSPATLVASLQISTRGEQYCAARPDGSLKCWGANERGQLGQGDMNHRGDQANEMGANLLKVDVGTGSLVEQVSVGLQYTCALMRSGALKCWGLNEYPGGQLGLSGYAKVGDGPGEMGDYLTSVNLGVTPEIRSIATGEWHACALFVDGSVKCWGNNGNGQLGLGDTNGRGDQPNEMGAALPFVSLPSNSVRQLAVGGMHTCALFVDGSVRCWGANHRGQLGLGHVNSIGDAAGEMGAALQAVNLGTGRTAVGIVAGRFHNCALLDDESTKCWGDNSYGQLGQGHATTIIGDSPAEMGDALARTALGTGRVALQTTANWFHTCAVLDDATTKCWGNNGYGQLGQGNIDPLGNASGQMGNALPVVPLGTGRSVRAVASSLISQCAILDNGSIKCWGGNAGGELGQGDKLQRGDGPNEMGNALLVVNLGP